MLDDNHGFGESNRRNECISHEKLDEILSPQRYHTALNCTKKW